MASAISAPGRSCPPSSTPLREPTRSQVRRATSSEQLSSVLESDFDGNPPVGSTAPSLLTGARRGMRRSISMHHIYEPAVAQFGVNKPAPALLNYSNASLITNERLTLLIQEILMLLSLLKFPHPPSTPGKYKALFVDQYLGICKEVLSKIVIVDYGKKRDEMITMILQVAKMLGCPTKVSKLYLCNPMSTSALKTSTLFLHWICCRVWNFHSQSIEAANAWNEQDSTVLDIICHKFNRSLNTGSEMASTLNGTGSFHTALGQSRRKSMSASASRTYMGTSLHEIRAAADRVEGSNATLEKKLKALIKANKERQNELTHLKSQASGRSPSRVSGGARVSNDLLAKRQLLDSLNEQIATLRQQDMVQEAVQSPEAHSSRLSHTAESDTSSEISILEGGERNNTRRLQIELEELETQKQDLMLKLFRAYHETRSVFPQFEGHFFVKILEANSYSLLHFTRYHIWLKAMEAFTDIACQDIEDQERRDPSLKNAVILDKLADHYGMTKTEVLEIKAKVNALIRQVTEEELQQWYERAPLEDYLNTLSFEVNESSFVNPNNENRSQ